MPQAMTPQNPFALTGKTALVAGASRGIGLASAQALARCGARTILAARSLEALERHAADLRAEGWAAEALRLDVADSESIRSAVDSLPAVDILVNMAGMNIRKSFLDYAPEERDRILSVNLLGFIDLTRRIGARMIERGQGGKVVNIGSLVSLIGLPYISIYAAAKSALAGLTRALAAEWGRYGIQVNMVAPGMIPTDLNRTMLEDARMREWMKGVVPAQRYGTTAEVARVVVFLGGPGSDYVTGQIIAVDGGASTTAVWPLQPS